MQAQQELMAAQKENGLSMFGGIGCLPLHPNAFLLSSLLCSPVYSRGCRQFLPLD